MTHARDEIPQDSHQITSTARHAATPHLKPCGTVVNRLPLVYKRRGRPPSHTRGRRAHLLAFPPSLTILALASVNHRDLEDPPLLPCL
jgi:hypothetical protein